MILLPKVIHLMSQKSRLKITKIMYYENNKERIKEYKNRPDVKERNKQYQQRPDVKERNRLSMAKKRQIPDYKIYIKEQNKKYRIKRQIEKHRNKHVIMILKNNPFRLYIDIGGQDYKELEKLPNAILNEVINNKKLNTIQSIMFVLKYRVQYTGKKSDCLRIMILELKTFKYINVIQVRGWKYLKYRPKIKRPKIQHLMTNVDRKHLCDLLYYDRNKERIRKRYNKEKMREYRKRPDVREKINKRKREYGRKVYLKLRTQALNIYGSKCVKCGEKDHRFLDFDHINDDGTNQRKKHTTSVLFYKYLIKEQPKDIQLLCIYCNQKKKRKYKIYDWNNSKQKERAKSRARVMQRRLTCLWHYSRTVPHCKKCGLLNIRYLHLDHINNDGNHERKKYGRESFYGYLIRNNFPSDLQVLCRDCHLRKK